MEYYTKVLRPEKSHESNNGIRDFEIEPYEPAHIKIQNMINAGQRLKAFRKDQFDFIGEHKESLEVIDPTRKKSFDMADASMIQNELDGRIKPPVKKEGDKKDENTKSSVPSDTDINISDADSDVVKNDRS